MKLFQRSAHSRHKAIAETLYREIVRQSRCPEFYLAQDVPDTADGRFDLIALHTFLFLRRLRGESVDSVALAQTLFDQMFLDMDHNLREMGVGDLSVGPQIKAMVAGFYGRIAAYDDGLADDDEALAAALTRNLYRNTSPAPDAVKRMAKYLRREAEMVVTLPLESLMRGEIAFGPPPGNQDAQATS